MKQGNQIPVVFTPDNNFVVQTCVAILSMLRTKHESTDYIFYIVVSDRFDISNLKYLEKLKVLEKSFRYVIKYVDSKIFENLKISSSSHITESTYYRLILADILKEDKCMYHDGDIIVNEDLSSMYNINMEDKYVAGVKTIVQQQGNPNDLKKIKEWGFKSLDQYILAGDLVLNLKLMREKNIVKFFIDEMKKGYPHQDQDVINFCCYNYICFLPLKYLVLNRWLNNNDIYNFKNQIHTNEEIREAKSNPVIVHFAGADVKPWNNLRTVYSDIWWKYAKELLDESEYSHWYLKAADYTRQRDIDCFFDKLNKEKRIILFGYGAAAKSLIPVLLRQGFNIDSIVDNDIFKKGTVTEEGILIMDVKSAVEKYPDHEYIITNQSFRQDILCQLLDWGIKESNIVSYYHKSHVYYQALDNKYAEYEDNLSRTYFK